MMEQTLMLMQWYSTLNVSALLIIEILPVGPAAAAVLAVRADRIARNGGETRLAGFIGFGVLAILKKIKNTNRNRFNEK